MLTPVVVYLLWRELGPSCLVGVGIILIQPPLQYVIARSHTRLWYVCIPSDSCVQICMYAYVHTLYIYVYIQKYVCS